ncbi:MAG: hypothetical protein KUF74_03540 [Candidatus Thiodiazotropha sp. (ex Ctena orbiculata)]|nr:hypothetical protein [Candidatus Thiodiazotropha taylori]
MITEKLIKKYLIYLYDDYTSVYGESLHNLDKSGELTLGRNFADMHPEAIIQLDEHTIRNLTPSLAKELEQRGFARTDSLSVYLTKEGFYEAKRLKHPIYHFLKKHWKWIIGTCVMLFASLVAVI